jgi:hypothetical protein
MTSTQKTLDKKTILWDAGRLADFANAESREAVENFRANNPDYFPPAVWHNASAPIPGEKGFDEILLKPDIESSFKPSYWFGVREALRDAWQGGFTDEHCVILLSFAGDIPLKPSGEVWPFQRSVMFLAVEDWRARFCGVCGKRFVADQPARRFCSTACTGKGRKASRRAYWKDKGKDWRANRKRKSSRRTKQ